VLITFLELHDYEVVAYNADFTRQREFLLTDTECPIQLLPILCAKPVKEKLQAPEQVLVMKKLV